MISRHSYIYAIHAPEPEHLEEVKEQMVLLGPPKIEVVDCGDYYMALDGSHRLAAAHALGIVPELVIWDPEDTIDVSLYDWFEWQAWDNQFVHEAGKVADYLYSPRDAVPYHFDQ